jgi:hypothetical protein
LGKELNHGIEVDQVQNRLVLSERAVSEAEEIEKRKRALEAVKIGGEYEGVRQEYLWTTTYVSLWKEILFLYPPAH